MGNCRSGKNGCGLPRCVTTPGASESRQRFLFKMQPALPLQPEEAGLLNPDVGGEGAGGVHVADRDIALVPQGVVGQAVAAEVLADVAVGPVGDGVQLPAAVLALEEVDVGAAAGLAAAQAGRSE